MPPSLCPPESDRGVGFCSRKHLWLQGPRCRGSPRGSTLPLGATGWSPVCAPLAPPPCSGPRSTVTHLGVAPGAFAASARVGGESPCPSQHRDHSHCRALRPPHAPRRWLRAGRGSRLGLRVRAGKSVSQREAGAPKGKRWTPTPVPAPPAASSGAGSPESGYVCGKGCGEPQQRTRGQGSRPACPDPPGWDAEGAGCQNPCVSRSQRPPALVFHSRCNPRAVEALPLYSGQSGLPGLRRREPTVCTSSASIGSPKWLPRATKDAKH